MKTAPELNESLVPFTRVAKFIRQLTHDVRNGLSAIDLEAAFIAELVTDPEVADELRKLRKMVANAAKTLRDTSQNFQPVTVHVMPWQAMTFFEELQARLPQEFPEEIQAGRVEVESHFYGAEINVDLEQIIATVFHVLRNAFQFRRDGVSVRLSGFVEGKHAVIEIHEPKAVFESQVPPEEWGNEPLLTTRQGGYGLGLFRARQILDAHDGEFETHFRDGILVTRILLPIWSDDVA